MVIGRDIEPEDVSLRFLAERLRQAKWPSPDAPASARTAALMSVAPPEGAHTRYLMDIKGRVYGEVQVFLPRGRDLPERVERWSGDGGAPFLYVTDTRTITLGVYGGSQPTWMSAPVFGSPAAITSWFGRLSPATKNLVGSDTALGMADKEFSRQVKQWLRERPPLRRLGGRDIIDLRDALIDRLTQLSTINVELAKDPGRLWPTHRIREHAVASIWYTYGYRPFMATPPIPPEQAGAVAEVLRVTLSVYGWAYDFGADLGSRDVIRLQDSAMDLSELLQTVAGHSQA